MSFATFLLVIPSSALVAIAISLIVLGARRMSRPARRSRIAGIRTIIAGIGTAAAAVVASAMWFTDFQYGVVIFPSLGLILGGIWASAWLVAAAIVRGDQRFDRRGGPTWCTDCPQPKCTVASGSPVST